jgi:hypothetical protein
MQTEHLLNDKQKLPSLKIVSYAGFAVGTIVLVCALTLLFFLNPFVNRFIKPRITKAFIEAYPACSIRIADMNYSVLKNRFGFDSVALSAVDSTFSSTIGPFSISGIGWMHLFWGGSLALNDFDNLIVDAQDIVLNFPQSRYKLHCEWLRVSVPDSGIVVEALEVYPLGDDEQFFAGSKFRETRFRLIVPHTRVMGLACLELLQKKRYHTRSIQIQDALLDVLVNKDKPNKKDAPNPPMPNDILASIKETLQIDSLSIVNGRLKYIERFEIGAKPAWITFDSIQALTEGITNHHDHGAAMVIHAQWKLANAGTMKLLMSIPVASPEFLFQYSGSLGRMDLSALNSFLEISDQMRIKTGVLQEVTFEVNFASGHASGQVRGVYRDLTLAAIDKYTRSEKGFSNGIISYLANTFKINKNNVPDKSGSIRIGEVKYIRQPDDSFINVVWFSLRTGVRDVVGF